jgi:Ser/Thr protein kinase RdoA (MazF antagonist)
MERSRARDHDGRSFATLDRREQVARLRGVARAALDRYGLADARVTLLAHEHHTTFRVRAAGDDYVLRVTRPGVHTPATVASEMAWLQAVSADTDLGVPAPVAARDGALAVLAHAPGMPGPRVCVLLRRPAGRAAGERLGVEQARAIARLQAGLREHALAWTRPDGFVRPRADTLTSAETAASIAPGVVVAPPWAVVEHPGREDADRSLQLVAELFAVRDAALLAAALDVVWDATRALAPDPAAAGLLHAGLAPATVVFDEGAAWATGAADCGWGFHLYDLAVTLVAFDGRPRATALRAAFLAEHEARGTLPAGADDRLAALGLLRRIQQVVRVVEAREQPALRERWHEHARGLLDRIADALQSVG